MPPAQDVFVPADLEHSSVSSSTFAMRDEPLTPPAETSPLDHRLLSHGPAHATLEVSLPTNDNTAAGMAMNQEDSLYLTPATSPVTAVLEEKEQLVDLPNDSKMEDDAPKSSYHQRDTVAGPHSSGSVESDESQHITGSLTQSEDPPTPVSLNQDRMDYERKTGERCDQRPERMTSPRMLSANDQHVPPGLAPVDLEFDRANHVQAWDFSSKRPKTRYPSALFQPYAKYIGTQQSDRHTYNVEVIILTVDMDQCSLSGYLSINGLTPEHPTLQTFFTGQIIGGPNQKYSFKTTDPAWGASNKDDLAHWLRFPPWRHLSFHAKRDMGFDFPTNGEAWWTQDHVFMRWKEHFLVPDHKQSNITGASFEGFYYICLNMAEGKISGVYFHGNSERYQQLELTHETKRGLGVFGMSPLIEFR